MFLSLNILCWCKTRNHTAPNEDAQAMPSPHPRLYTVITQILIRVGNITEA